MDGPSKAAWKYELVLNIFTEGELNQTTTTTRQQNKTKKEIMILAKECDIQSAGIQCMLKSQDVFCRVLYDKLGGIQYQWLIQTDVKSVHLSVLILLSIFYLINSRPWKNKWKNNFAKLSYYQAW